MLYAEKLLILIASCRMCPDGNTGLQTMAAALGARIVPWQDITPEAIASSTQKQGVQMRDVIVLPLAAWDYSKEPAAYQQWLEDLQALGVCVVNPPSLQLWNMNKLYLCELADKRLPVTPSIALLPHVSAQDWAETIAQSDWQNPVVKPLVGQSGNGVRRLLQNGHAHLPTLDEFPQGALLQPFVVSPIGEVCLIYINGQFSHAAHRKTAEAEWRANCAYGVQILPISPQQEWLHCAEAVLHQLPMQPQVPLYARIDGLIDASNNFMVNEVELIEPALYPHLRADFAEIFKQSLQTNVLERL